jgi:hypothetical protein
VTIKASWRIEPSPIEEGFPVTLSKEVKVSIPEASNKIFLQIRANILKELSSPDLSLTEMLKVSRWIRNVKHRELAPAAFIFLDHPKQYREIQDFVFKYLDSLFDDDHRQGPYVDYLCTEKPIAAQNVINRLSNRPDISQLTLDDWRRLESAPNVFVRAMLFARYPKKMSAESAIALLKELSGIKPSLSPMDGKAFITQLDDPLFRKRELAMTKLIDLGESALPALKLALQEPTSTDREERIKKIISKIDVKRLEPLEQSAVHYLDEYFGPSSILLLEELAKNNSESFITVEAKRVLAKNRKK